MRVAVIGSERFKRTEFAKEITRSVVLGFSDFCDEFLSPVGSAGVAGWVRDRCKELQLPLRQFPRDEYSKWVDYADAVLAVWNGSSREWIYSTVRHCERKGKPIYVVNVDEMTCGDAVWKMLGMCGSPLLDDLNQDSECSKLVHEMKEKFQEIKLKYHLA